mgnify:CR=1 FL=1
MELLQSIALLLVIFVAWLYLAKFINDNYQRSRGWSALFWVILLFGTLSFLFGSSGSNSSSGGGDYDYDDDCYKNPWDSDDSSGWGSDDSSSSFGGDDE